MTDQPNPLEQRASQVDAKLEEMLGTRLHEGITQGIGTRMREGKLTQTELIEKLNRSDAVEALLYEGLAGADEETWRKWRDGQPKRAARIEAVNRERDR